jgi:hypothetical protein
MSYRLSSSDAIPGRLPTGQRGHRVVQRDGQAELGGHLRGPLVEVGAAQIEPAFQRHGVRVVRPGPPVGQLVGGRVHGRLRRTHPGAPEQEVPHRLAGPPLPLLRQVADVRRGRAQRHGAGLRRGDPGERAQQRALPGAVDPHQADHVARRDHQIQSAEQAPVAVPGGEIAGDHRGVHVPVNATRAVIRLSAPPPR